MDAESTSENARQITHLCEQQGWIMLPYRH